MSVQSLQLNDRIVDSFAVGKVFKDQTKMINSLDFTVDGRFLISASEDDSVCIFDCEKGERSKMLFSKKYGCANIKFVHSGALSAICSSRNDFDHSLRYWDLYENKFIRFFKGHVGEVKGLDVHPYEDLFLSSSVDRTCLLWDLRKEKPIGRIPAKHTPASAFDNQGLIFGVAAGDQKVHLFDSRAFDKGEFTFFDLSRFINNNAAQITKMDFSPCGKFIVVCTDQGHIFSIDSFKGQLAGSYRLGASMGDCVPSFSPDSQYIACGTSSGPIHVYRTVAPHDDGIRQAPLVAKWEGHSGFPRNVLFNPMRCMVASACSSNIALWIPQQ
jgi:COMPASS component SWD2